MRFGRIRTTLLSLLFATAAVAQQPFTGRVTDENGNGLEGVAIAVQPANDFVDTNAILKNAACKSAADGSFEITTEIRSPVRIAFAKRGRQGCALFVNRPMDAAPALGDVLLPKGAQLIGRVRNEDGKPIAGAQITIKSAIAERAKTKGVTELLAGATANERGIFVLHCVPGTGMALTASKPGMRDVHRIVAQDSALDLTMEPLELVTGKVVDDEGNGVASALVWLQTPIPDEHAMRHTRTARDGSFTLHAPRDDARYRLEVRGPHPRGETSGGLLRGPQRDVVITAGAAGASKLVERRLLARNKETGERLREFSVAPLRSPLKRLQTNLLVAQGNLRPHTDEAVLTVRSDHVRGFLVAAPGRAFAIVELPPSSEPVTVDLGPEAFVTGEVRDENGKPMANVTVRALPKASGRGNTPLPRNLPQTDANGRFRIGGLRAGDYGVQAHAEGRLPSPPVFFTAAVGENEPLTLNVPAAIVARFEVEGELPTSPIMQVQLRRAFGAPTGPGDYLHPIAEPDPIRLTTNGPHAFGPLRTTEAQLSAFFPSRTRIGVGTTLSLGTLAADGQLQTIRLPDAPMAIVNGRIDPSHPIDMHFVAVTATPTANVKQRPHLQSMRPCVAGVRSDGRFTMDLPHGDYCLQLVDLRTGIIFHTEPKDVAIDGSALTLRPQVHWLEVFCERTDPTRPLVVSSMQLELLRPRRGEHAAFFPAGGKSGDSEKTLLPWPAGATTQRWLVPAGKLRATAICRFDLLHHDRVRKQFVHEVSTTEVTIEENEHDAILTIPPPPTDDEIRSK